MGNVMETVAAAGGGDPVTDKTTDISEKLSNGMFYAASSMKGWRMTMEDQHTCCDLLPVKGRNRPLENHSVFAVYDGHGGGFSSEYASQHLVKILSQQAELQEYAKLPKKEGDKSRQDANGIELLRNALQNTFVELDRNLRTAQEVLKKQQMEEIHKLQKEKDVAETIIGAAAATTKIEKKKQSMEHSGSTCVVVLITPSHILCANAGDSRAILRRNNRVLPLSFDHKPSNFPESERIVSAGGYVRHRRVNGDLAVSRGFGDYSYKDDSQLPDDKQWVIAKPDVVVCPRDLKKDEFIVLACDGVWDVQSNEECSETVQQILTEGETNMGLLCEEVLDICLAKNSRDNMTIVMVGFPGINMARSSMSQRDAVLARREARKSLADEAKTAAQAAVAEACANIGIGESGIGKKSGAKVVPVVTSDDVPTQKTTKPKKPAAKRASQQQLKLEAAAMPSATLIKA